MYFIINFILIMIGLYIGIMYERKDWLNMIESDEMLKDTYKIYLDIEREKKEKAKQAKKKEQKREKDFI